MPQSKVTQGEKEGPSRPLLPPVIRGLIWAGVGFLVFNTLMILVDPGPAHPFITEPSVTVGWIAAVIGWILGIGAWENVVLPALGYAEPPQPSTGWRRYFGFSTDHKVIGLQYLTFSAFTFFLAGLLAMIMRAQLMEPNLWLFAYSGQYLQTVGIHGTLMMFAVGTVAMVGGLGNYFVPLQIGTRETVFPRLSGISFWMVPAGVMTIALSPLLGWWTTGWRAYEPLAATEPSGMVFYYLGVFAMTLSSLIVALNLTTTIIYKRTRGLTWNRVPMFTWGILVVSLLNLIWLPEIEATFVLSLLDRIIPFHFFDALGSPLTYMNLFWLFGHPEVYIVVVPALAMWQEILPVMGRKSLFARNWGILGLIFVMLLSGMVWAHHMFTNMSNIEMLPFSFFTEMISIPTGFAFLVAIGTIWRSRLRLSTPTILVLMSMVNFLVGGMTGVFLADVPVNMQVHNTFFVVGHFHYTIIGGMVFAWLAAMYYWLPKLSGRFYNEKWGKMLAVWVFIGFNGTFSQMFLVGLHGMNRWVAIYPAYLQSQNFWISIFAFILGIGFVGHLAHIVWAWSRGPAVAENPWQAKTLEWQTSSPPPKNNFEVLPQVTAGFYTYGDDAPAVVKPVAGDGALSV